MAAAVLHSLQPPDPPYAAHARATAPAPSPVPSFASTSTSPSPVVGKAQAQATTRPFQRFRSSVEQTLRTATRSKKALPLAPSIDDFATFKGKGKAAAPDDALLKAHKKEKEKDKGRGKQKEKDRDDEKEKEKEKSNLNMLRRVAFRRTTPSPLPSTPTPTPTPSSPSKLKTRPAPNPSSPSRPPADALAGFTSFVTPSMRQASMSSPALSIPSEFITPTNKPSTPTRTPSSRGPPTPSKPNTSTSTSSHPSPPPQTPSPSARVRRTSLQPSSPLSASASASASASSPSAKPAVALAGSSKREIQIGGPMAASGHAQGRHRGSGAAAAAASTPSLGVYARGGGGMESGGEAGMREDRSGEDRDTHTPTRRRRISVRRRPGDADADLERISNTRRGQHTPSNSHSSNSNSESDGSSSFSPPPTPTPVSGPRSGFAHQQSHQNQQRSPAPAPVLRARTTSRASPVTVRASHSSPSPIPSASASRQAPSPTPTPTRSPSTPTRPPRRGLSPSPSPATPASVSNPIRPSTPSRIVPRASGAARNESPIGRNGNGNESPGGEPGVGIGLRRALTSASVSAGYLPLGGGGGAGGGGQAVGHRRMGRSVDLTVVSGGGGGGGGSAMTQRRPSVDGGQRKVVESPMQRPSLDGREREREREGERRRDRDRNRDTDSQTHQQHYPLAPRRPSIDAPLPPTPVLPPSSSSPTPRRSSVDSPTHSSAQRRVSIDERERRRVVPPLAPALPITSSPLPPTPTSGSTSRRPTSPSQSSPSLARRPTSPASRTDSRVMTPPGSPVRARATPTGRAPSSYAQNRHFNISASELVLPVGVGVEGGSESPLMLAGQPAFARSSANANATNGNANANARQPALTPRELVRTATALVLRELAPGANARPPAHVARSEAGVKEWAEVEARVRVLVRMERGWGAARGREAKEGKEEEEKEARDFMEVLRDGFVLCHLMNKLRAASIVRPDTTSTSTSTSNNTNTSTANVTKFLAACASYGLAPEDLFQRDDLASATKAGAAARVARTVAALVRFADEDGARSQRVTAGSTGTGERLGFGASATGGGDRVWLRGQGLSRERAEGAGEAQRPQTPTRAKGGMRTTPSSPYTGHVYGAQGSMAARGASASTPNLLLPAAAFGGGGSGRESPSSPRKMRRWSPPEDMPPLRSNSPEEGSSNGGHGGQQQQAVDGVEAEVVKFRPADVPQIRPPPPPKSPLRNKASVSGGEKEKEKAGKDKSGGLFAWARSAASPSGKSSSSPAAAPASAPALSSSVSTSVLSGSSAQTEGGGGRHHEQAAMDDAITDFRPNVNNANANNNLNHNHHSHNHSPSHSPTHPSSQPRPVHRSSGHTNHSTSSNLRQSVASSALSAADTDITTTSAATSAFGFAYSGLHQQHGNAGMYGTIRTVTTDMTSEAPSVSRTEGSMLAEEVMRKRSGGGEGGSGGNGVPMSGSPGSKALYGMGMGMVRERKMSEAPALDLTRVAEETDESVSSKGHTRSAQKEREKEKEKGQGRAPQEQQQGPVHLRKGKWPDDFMNAFQYPSTAQSIPASNKRPSPEYYALNDSDSANGTDSPRQLTPVSISPPRKLAIVASRRSGEGDPLPRRPTHRPRHSMDSPGLLPKDALLRREASPDSLASASSSGRVMLRRHSTKPEVVVAGRQGRYVPRSPSNSRVVGGGGSNDETSSPDSDAFGGDVGSAATAPVPFPRSVSAVSARENGAGTPPGDSSLLLGERPRLLRGRFQSDVDSASSAARRRAGGRPNSYDELGIRPQRSRIESMVNLGGASSAASASDLLSRDSMDGSAVRMRLVVREDGKPPTHFQLGNCIGRGQFGSVYRALNLNTGQMVAVKRIRLEGLKEEEVTTLMREVDLVKSLSHPSIVKYEGMARDDDTLSIVLEYAENGSLGQTLKAFGKLNERLVASYVVKILEGLHYLHTSDVVHCDLKAANILTTKNGNVKLSDFGVSLNLRAMEREIKDVAGTPNWMAPEVIELKGASTKSDIWSLGCTVIELLTGRPPYAEIANSMSVMFRIVEDAMPPMPEGSSEMLQDFLEQCFYKDPTLRPSAEILCEHPWLKNNWVELKELRPQDSIPFLRRVSTDLHKSDAIRHLSQLEIPDSPISSSPKDIGRISPMTHRASAVSVRPVEGEFSPREHTFVKTTFSKPMVCRVCQLSVKKTAVLCSQCSLISHAKCAENAPPTCDLRAHLLLYAQYAEKGNPASAYSNPVINDIGRTGALSDVPFVDHNTPPPSTTAESPRPSIQQAHSTPEHPPTAFKFMAAFRRSRTSLTPTPEPTPVAPSTSTSPTPKDEDARAVRKRPTVLHKRPQQERPLSMTSTSTGLSSLRSAATAAESFSSRQHTGQRSHMSSGKDSDKERRRTSDGALLERVRSSKITASGRSEATTDRERDEARSPDQELPGALPKTTKKHKAKAASTPSSNCVLQ